MEAHLAELRLHHQSNHQDSGEVSGTPRVSLEAGHGALVSLDTDRPRKYSIFRRYVGFQGISRFLYVLWESGGGPFGTKVHLGCLLDLPDPNSPSFRLF